MRIFTLIFAGALLMGACGSEQKRDTLADELKSGPRCIDLCSSRFQACTTSHPGDYSACSGEQRQCDTECRAQEAEKHAEENTIESVEPVEPIEPIGTDPPQDAPSEEEPTGDGPTNNE